MLKVAASTIPMNMRASRLPTSLRQAGLGPTRMSVS